VKSIRGLKKNECGKKVWPISMINKVFGQENQQNDLTDLMFFSKLKLSQKKESGVEIGAGLFGVNQQ
jgi:hypothetical protein